jgi:hypothetical protein
MFQNVSRFTLIVICWWISGVRIQLLPAGFVTVSDASTHLPIELALVKFSHKSNASGRLGELEFLAFGGGSPHMLESEKLRYGLTNASGRAFIFPQLRLVWQWWKFQDWQPQFRDVIHPTYSVVKCTVRTSPHHWWTAWWPVVIEIQMEPKASIIERLLKIRPDDLLVQAANIYSTSEYTSYVATPVMSQESIHKCNALIIRGHDERDMMFRSIQRLSHSVHGKQ